MQRAALVAVRIGCVGLGLWLSGCKDDPPPAIVDDDTIGWQLTSDANAFKPHAPGKNADFDVSCSASGDSLSFTITAKPVEEGSIPRSVLSVRRGTPGSDLCLVTVIEEPSNGGSPFTLTDSCKGTDPDGGCTLTGDFDSDGWAFNGTLICTKLRQTVADKAFFTLYDSVNSKGPVKLRLDNCD